MRGVWNADWDVKKVFLPPGNVHTLCNGNCQGFSTTLDLRTFFCKSVPFAFLTLTRMKHVTQLEEDSQFTSQSLLTKILPPLFVYGVFCEMWTSKSLRKIHKLCQNNVIKGGFEGRLLENYELICFYVERVLNSKKCFDTKFISFTTKCFFCIIVGLIDD